MRARRVLAIPLYPLAFASIVVATTLSPRVQADTDPKALLSSKCMACHLPNGEGKLNRIDQSRRTPEGWDMTIGRMIAAHGVSLTGDERQILVKYLADTHGLAPDETAGRRYILEREFTQVETPDDKRVAETCARCHSYARIALQRRTPEDWRKLANFHVGQYPTIEIQQAGRDRDWWKIASEEMPKRLGKLYAFNAPVWDRWLATQKSSAQGSWRVVGHRPGWGAYEGAATISADGADKYSVKMDVRYANGKSEHGEGKGVVYTGFEWRAAMKLGDLDTRQVFELSPDGKNLKGRWHVDNVDSIGGEFEAVRVGNDSPAQILLVEPRAIKVASTARINIYGSHLTGDIKLGDGLRLIKVIEQNADKVVLEVEAKPGSKNGVRSVVVGSAQVTDALAIYDKIDHLSIEPDTAMARVGGNGGARPKVPVQFEAIAYAKGAGEQGEAVRLGYFNATWSVKNLNANADAMEDAKFAGAMQSDGLFVPGEAGPNPARKYHTNNAGELNVIAVVDDGGHEVKASKPLIVTVQRWNDPPIR
ncbi:MULTISPECIES: quinohemoprotein amine dehydrogenase subunit alpha [unclassified Pseudomonas]|uniref:quinohemoprotein amine dehydrogenase subunit alpha n=1 Tax=unclassified Pseudomonas TaxID=196821 RepID=UPI000CD198B9|nr:MULTISPECIES: quinohemoprotein amine dehydrogenase subunit alpha [unclassified Pseudomonas]POA28195.1 quinohemoprotein amine dehydrogenase subunit alpha [Pseudomonas sp. GW456-R21]POA62125.1 quinohemoprotein amine dehydrogenase subunit alpha [Pseudomonas sp. GW460-R15]